MKLKYLIVGFIAGVFAATAITAGASTVYEKFTAVARPDYTLVVDGEQVTLKTPPKTIDGVTHLPIREVATILDKDVKFNSASGTIELKSTESEGDKMFVQGRQLIEILGVKYPQMVTDKTLTLDSYGVLKIGDVNYQLEMNDSKLFNITPLIEAQVVNELDFQ